MRGVIAGQSCAFVGVQRGVVYMLSEWRRVRPRVRIVVIVRVEAVGMTHQPRRVRVRIGVLGGIVEVPGVVVIPRSSSETIVS